ncbi:MULTISPECIES: late competence development ComFB family protein [unclassified Vibrio]|uniref:late competence development ComFB family protein n=2 Tax=Vibrio TaxID=662 RepID=UPI001361B761|nr:MULTISPECIES: late competence development ComFB family protein [unclassified Vibrio]NAW56290.1 competence protein ComFB [Vibrio sp. V36_P2S2PM302]NAX21414.1 competence protein ComFB [Vibrio sp. V39_P1S14PM300]NAX27217.1 competence protein ComFB [Vibrio sp. V38_P2S17PM301]
MQISVDVHNYMETLVGQVLTREAYANHFTHDQLADLACLALSQLRPVYIRYDIDFLSALPEHKMLSLQKAAEDAVFAAESMIIDDRRQNRDEHIPFIRSSNKSESDTLEWYEKPIINIKRS